MSSCSLYEIWVQKYLAMSNGEPAEDADVPIVPERTHSICDIPESCRLGAGDSLSRGHFVPTLKFENHGNTKRVTPGQWSTFP